MEAIGSLMDTVRSAAPTVMVVALVAAFFTLAGMLLSWRKIVPRD